MEIVEGREGGSFQGDGKEQTSRYTTRVHDAFADVLHSIVARKDMMNLLEQILKAVFVQTHVKR